MRCKTLFKVWLIVLSLGCTSVVGADCEAVDGGSRDARIETAIAKVQEGPFAIKSKEGAVLRGCTFKEFDSILFGHVLRVHEQKGVESPFRVLDYGCGTGRWAAIAALLAEYNKLSIAVDARDPYLEDMHAEYYTAARSGFEDSFSGPVSKYSLAKGVLADAEPGYDVIVFRDVIHLLTAPQRGEFFESCKAKMTDGGVLFISVGVPFNVILRNPVTAIGAAKRSMHLPNFADVYEGKSRAFFEKFFDGAVVPDSAPPFLKAFTELALRSVGVTEVIASANEQGWRLAIAATADGGIGSEGPEGIDGGVLFKWIKELYDRGSNLQLLHFGFKRVGVVEDEHSAAASAGAEEEA